MITARSSAFIKMVQIQFLTSTLGTYPILSQHLSTQKRLLTGRADEIRPVDDIIELTCQCDRYGYRRIAAKLRHAGLRGNNKRVEGRALFSTIGPSTMGTRQHERWKT